MTTCTTTGPAVSNATTLTISINACLTINKIELISNYARCMINKDRTVTLMFRSHREVALFCIKFSEYLGEPDPLNETLAAWHKLIEEAPL